jgi:gamma-glutamyltranspeptidase
MELQDLHNYRSQWRQPRYIRYRECDVYTASGRSYGGAWSLLVLKTLEPETRLVGPQAVVGRRSRPPGPSHRGVLVEG